MHNNIMHITLPFTQVNEQEMSASPTLYYNVGPTLYYNVGVLGEALISCSLTLS